MRISSSTALNFFLSLSIAEDLKEQIRLIFASLDDAGDGNGKVSLQEMMTGGHGQTVEELFEEFSEEFLLQMLQKSIRKEQHRRHMETAKSHFSAKDANHDGRLTRSEFEGMQHDEDSLKIFAQYDSDQNNFLSLEEYAAFEYPGEEYNIEVEEFDTLLSMADTNGDGRLSLTDEVNHPAVFSLVAPHISQFSIVLDKNHTSPK